MPSVFITGGNRGIGLETARQMAKLGYKVIVSCRSEEQAKAAVEKLAADGATADYVIMDTCDESSVEKAAAEVSKKVDGVLDVLINNAGYACPREPVTSINLAELRKCYEVNVIGSACVTNHFLPLVKKSPAGRIVNVGSIMGSCEKTFLSMTAVPYSCSKAALNMYTVNLASALKDTNVKVNCGHPGWVKTDMGGQDADLEVSEGAETNVYLATLPADGPTGGFFHKKERLPW
ncbi:short chain dehydrogenase [Novymonas esmeraldas]|uniref:Short chain dehydrogenase n=1 Tax=Novymonas esmeraldas TaxID=1808958 RepID=A0AAW0EXZ7_9TRYP